MSEGSSSPPPAKPQVRLEDVIGPPGSGCTYEKVKVLGKGSFGEAHLVRRKKDAKLLVAKLLDLSQMSERDQKYVEAEIHCLASCHHFAIVRYEEDFCADPKMLIVMEFADAGDLNQQIKARAGDMRFFEEHEVGYTFIQIAMALDHVHRGRMLHRDIKGANVLLMQSGLVKLGDFGFSQQYEDTVSGAVAGTFCGTPYYLAPELWKRQRYSKKADIWALGVLLYEMMALKRPFQGRDMKPLMESVLKGQIPPLPDHFSQDLRNLCYRMLTPDPNERPSIMSLFRTPYFDRLLGDFEKSSQASTLIDADTKALILENIKECREHMVEEPSRVGDVGTCNKDVHYEGPIRKESNRVWKDRYFQLKDGTLTIMVKKGDTATRGISVTTLASVVPVSAKTANAEGVFALQTTENKTMWMQAPSKAECKVWIQKIQEAMGIA